MIYIAFLRGIMPQMIAAHRMENLRKIFSDLGFEQVRSFIASGNIIFESPESDKKKLETKIEKTLKEKTGIDTPTIIRTQEELEDFVKENPFKQVSVSESAKPNVTFFKNPPVESKLPKEGRGFKGYGMACGAYCYTVDITSVKTPEAMMTLEKLFGKEITTRTWNTVQRVLKLCQSS